jgi:phosphatidate cytidylyltransferase
VITAVIFAALALALFLYGPPQLMAAVIGLLVLAAAWEWSGLCGFTAHAARAAYVALLALVLGLSAWRLAPLPLVDEAALETVFAATGVAWLLATIAVVAYPRGGTWWGACGSRALIGLVVLTPPWLAVLYLRSRPEGGALVLLGIALIAFVDIGAYFAGRAIGGPKLMPRVSPAKTWAGLGGGLLASLALALLAAAATGLPMPHLPAWLGWCMATALASVIGDLLESMVKRHSGIKDSGSLLPGHGGLFDRLDSLTAGLPVFALGVLVNGGFWA